MRAGGRRIFTININSRRNSNKRRKMAAAVRLDWRAETDTGVPMWGLNGVSKIIGIATVRGH